MITDDKLPYIPQMRGLAPRAFPNIIVIKAEPLHFSTSSSKLLWWISAFLWDVPRDDKYINEIETNTLFRRPIG